MFTPIAAVAGVSEDLTSGIPVIDLSQADGVFSLLWLVIALPLAGAAILLLGGKATDAWGHLLGCATAVGSFLLSLVLFFSLLGQADDSRSIGQHLFDWVDAGQFHAGMDQLYDPLSSLFLLLITGVGP